MAVLDPGSLNKIRSISVRETKLFDTGVTKTQFNNSIQAIEDIIDAAAFRNAVSSNIDTATSPIVLTNVQKKLIVKHYFKEKFNLGG